MMSCSESDTCAHCGALNDHLRRLVRQTALGAGWLCFRCRRLHRDAPLCGECTQMIDGVTNTFPVASCGAESAAGTTEIFREVLGALRLTDWRLFELRSDGTPETSCRHRQGSLTG